MANPFSNANRAVESYSFNKTNTRGIDTISDTAAANSALRKIQEEEREAAFESSLLQKDVDHYYNKLNEKVVNRYVKESQIPNNLNKISKTAKDAVLKDILFEVFYNSLLMDKEFLVENADTIKAITDKYIDDNGGFELLDKAIQNATFDPALLKRMKKICESTALEVCNRKLKDSKECGQVDLIDFDMNETEKAKLDMLKTNELNIERISELVKDKVLTVVKDEKERQELHSELIDNLENDLKNDENVTDEESLNEAISKLMLNKTVVEESTLFDALFRDAYHEFITENVAIVSADKDNIDDFKEFSKNYDTEMDEETALSNEENPEDKEINMDIILTEAITKYTLMETLYTLGLENYSHENIKKLTERMLNPVTEAVEVITESEDYQKNRSEFFKYFNKLKDDPDNETVRNNYSKWISSACKSKETTGECKSFVKIANSQIDQIIEKNPKMKDRYTGLSTFLSDSVK